MQPDRSISQSIHPKAFRHLGLPALSLILLALLPVSTLTAQTPSAQFRDAQTTLSLGLNNPEGIAVDSGGNLYISDDNCNCVVKATLSGGKYTTTTIASGFYLPDGVALDASGNVYVADVENNRIVKLTLSGGTYTQSTLISGLLQPYGVAVDTSGNLYISEAQSNLVLKETPSSGGYTQSTVTASVLFPAGLAVDTSGNIYIAANYGLFEETPSGGGYTQSTVDDSFLGGEGVALDASGNVYVSDIQNNEVVKETPSGGAYTHTTIINGLNDPLGVAADQSGSVYVADNSTSGGNGRILEVQTQAVNFGTVPVGTATAITSLTFSFASAGQLGAPAVLTGGAPGLDFTDAGTGTCTSNGSSHTYATGNTCTVDVIFKPRFAGARNGAVNLIDTSGSLLATAYIFGTGLGPQIAFGPGTQSTVAQLPSAPASVAVDGAGNVYVALPYAGVVAKETLSGDTYTQSNVATGLGAQGVAVDGAGNVYIAGGVEVVKETLSGGTYVQSTIATGLLNPTSVAVDGAGNVYIVAADEGLVLKETPSGGAYVQSTVFSGFGSPYSVAVDAAGNVYIAQVLYGQVLKETLTGGAYVQSTVVSGLTDPFGLALDAAGDLYIATGGNNQILKETLSGGAYMQTVLQNGVTSVGLAVALNGNVYIASASLLNPPAATTGQLELLDFVDTPSLSFAATLVGNTSSDSPQSVEIENIGNATLSAIAPGLTISTNFEQVPGSGTPADCSSSFSLTPGASCNLSISFKPTTGGPLQGTAALTDNASNANPATQTIQLSGTGQQTAPTLVFTPVANQTYGAAPFTVNATSNSSGAITYSVVSGPATIAGSTVTITGIGTVVLRANQAASGVYAAKSVTTSFTVSAAPPTLSFAAIANQTYGAAPFTVSATSNSSGAITYSVVSGPATITGSTVTVTGVGKVVLQASQAASGDYTAQTAQTSFSVLAASQTISFNAIPAQTSGTTLLLNASASSGLPVTFASSTAGVCTVSGTTATLINAGTCTIQASQPGNADYTAATPVSQSFSVQSAASFTITPNPGTETIKRGVLGGFLLELKSVNGFKGKVSLSCSGGPTGSYCANLPMTVSLNGTAFAISGILFPKDSAAGTYVITFTGTSGSLTETATATFIVK